MLSGELMKSPKRDPRTRDPFHSIYPYYASFTEEFAKSVLASARLNRDSRILDLWNGSGTTTAAANTLGLHAVGYDISPVMVVVARARLTASTEWSSLMPLGLEILDAANRNQYTLAKDDPLLDWFHTDTALWFRTVERTIFRFLVAESLRSGAVNFCESVSSIASCMYLSLFSVVRAAAASRRSSNPTWLKLPREQGERMACDRNVLRISFLTKVDTLTAWIRSAQNPASTSVVRSADTATDLLEGKYDFVLTSPPYCTRIDYAAGSRLELAVLSPAISISFADLRAAMLGTTAVPKAHENADTAWGGDLQEFFGGS